MIRRSTGLLAFLIALLSLPAAAYTGGGNATVMLLGSPSANCGAWPNCPTVLNSAAAPLYTLDPTVNASIQSLLTALAAPLPLPTGASTSQLQTTANGYLANISGRVTGNLALDSSVQSLLTTLQAPLTFNLPANAANATNQATANGYLLTLATASAAQATGAKQDTGNTSLATIAAAQGAQGTGSTFNPPAGGSGILGYLSGIYKAITGTLTVGLPSNAAQETGGNLAATAGSAATTATNTGNTASNTSTTAINTGTTATNTGAISTATGAQADAAYSGSGSSSIIAALKGLYAKLAGTLTIQGAANGTPVVTGPPKLTAYGTLSATAASVALSTLTVGPNSAVWSTTYPSNYVSIRNSVASAGIVYFCPLGGTCSATVGEPIAQGETIFRNVGNAVSPTLFAASTATVIAEE